LNIDKVERVLADQAAALGSVVWCCDGRADQLGRPNG